MSDPYRSSGAANGIPFKSVCYSVETAGSVLSFDAAKQLGLTGQLWCITYWGYDDSRTVVTIETRFYRNESEFNEAKREAEARGGSFVTSKKTGLQPCET